MKNFLPKSKNNPSGFTLIELMVVITIIAFLSVIGIVSFTRIQSQARDGRRRADVDAISTAMEANKDPLAGTYRAWTDTTIYANAAQPLDPINAGFNGKTYTYNMTGGAANSTTYSICAMLENFTGNAGPTSATTITASTSCTPTTSVNGNGQCYCRNNQ